MSKGITSTEGLIRKVFAIPKDEDKLLFYRGHSDKHNYKLQPSLYREKGHLDNEAVMFRELLISNPEDFSGDRSTLDKLVRMQHHSLPTRLLDVSSNPLMALYFACKSHSDKTGQIIVFHVNKSELKFFDSDTASCIANLSKLQKEDKKALNFSLSNQDFNTSLPVRKLLHFIREEKPYFLDKIEQEHLRSIICVKSRMNNTRIISQSGAFLLFGFDAVLPEEGTSQIAVSRIDIKAEEKNKILRELDALSINESTAFPYIENSAKYIAEKHKM